METLSVREAREQLSTLLDQFRHGDRKPVGVGSHRKTEGVLVPIEVYDELIAERANSVTQAAASLRAEGLAPGPEVESIVDRWAQGELTTEQMRSMVRAVHGVA